MEKETIVTLIIIAVMLLLIFMTILLILSRSKKGSSRSDSTVGQGWSYRDPNKEAFFSSRNGEE